MGRERGHARRLGAALVAAVALGASPARAEEPRVTCVATRGGRRVLVRPEAHAFVPAELDRLLRLGMAGKLEVTLTLVRRRRLWFDARVSETRLTQVLAFSKDEGYALDGRPLSQGAGALELERVAWTLEEPPEPAEDFAVRVEVRLQVVTAASLGKVAAWLTRGEPRGEGEDGALTQNLLRTVAEDLTRRASGRCDVRPSEGG
jgi:hypothetical protein